MFTHLVQFFTGVFLLLFVLSCSKEDIPPDDTPQQSQFSGAVVQYSVVPQEVKDKNDFVIGYDFVTDTVMVPSVNITIVEDQDGSYTVSSSNSAISSTISTYLRIARGIDSGIESLDFDCSLSHVNCSGSTRTIEFTDNQIESHIWKANLTSGGFIYNYEHNTDPDQVMERPGSRYITTFDGQ